MSVLREHHAALTRREREVMELVLSGLLNKQIAAKLGITEITVKVHRGTMMRKMGADSFLDLVKIATRLRPMPVTKAETAAARPLNTRIAVRSGSRRTKSDVGATLTAWLTDSRPSPALAGEKSGEHFVWSLRRSPTAGRDRHRARTVGC